MTIILLYIRRIIAQFVPYIRRIKIRSVACNRFRPFTAVTRARTSLRTPFKSISYDSASRPTSRLGLARSKPLEDKTSDRAGEDEQHADHDVRDKCGRFKSCRPDHLFLRLAAVLPVPKRSTIAVGVVSTLNRRSELQRRRTCSTSTSRSADGSTEVDRRSRSVLPRRCGWRHFDGAEWRLLQTSPWSF